MRVRQLRSYGTHVSYDADGTPTITICPAGSDYDPAIDRCVKLDETLEVVQTMVPSGSGSDGEDVIEAPVDLSLPEVGGGGLLIFGLAAALMLFGR